MSLLAALAGASLTEQSVGIETVPVTSPANRADTNGLGQVNQAYRIGKYEVTLRQYTDFLNTVAAVTSQAYLLDLWSFEMVHDRKVAGIDRQGAGTTNSPYVYSVIGDGNRPVTHVTWFDAARFANWVNNGGRTSSSTETGAYSLNGATNGLMPARSSNAVWWIPSQNEWYKSAFYDPALSAGAGGYYRYPTKSNVPPVAAAEPPGGPGSANWGNVRPEFDKLTVVGAYSNSPSAFGTFDQAGNVLEWSDSATTLGLGIAGSVMRGGAYDVTDAVNLSSAGSGAAALTTSSSATGFRLASSTNAPAPVRPAITGYAFSQGNFTITWSGTAPWPVVVQRSTHLSAGPWTVVSSNNTSLQYTDTNAPSPKAFYRIYVP